MKTRFSRSTAHTGILLAGLLLFVGGACSSNQETSSIEMLAVSNVELQSTEGRVWSEVGLRELFRLPGEAEDEELFFTPGAVRADQRGNIYVVDFYIQTIYGFDSTGRYVATYGGSMGAGPGELMSILDMGVVGDSAVYIVDNRARKISYFELDGTFLRSENLDFTPIRHKVTSDGRSYSMVEGMLDHLFETRKGADIATFGSVAPAPHGRGGSGIALGMITTFEKNMVYAPSRFPILAQYKPDGTIEYVRGTPDWGTVELPEWETLEIAGTQGYRAVGQVLNEEISEEEGKVYVVASMESEPGKAIDVYEARTGDYEHSFRIGEIKSPYLLNQRLYGIEADTTVVVYAVE